MTMKARVQSIGGTAMLGIAESGHTVVMDGPPEHGGNNLGLRPMELLLLGLGGCTEFDVLHILRKARQKVTGCVVELTAERAPVDPKVFVKIHVRYIVSGHDLNPEQVERAIKLSAEKYCSASIMLGATAEISHDFEVCPAD